MHLNHPELQLSVVQKFKLCKSDINSHQETVAAAVAPNSDNTWQLFIQIQIR